MRGFLIGLSTGAALLPGPALAQSGNGAPISPRAAASQSQSYDASFFAKFAPRSALDIVQQVPGFSLDLGNSDIRGFAQAAGNVVIDGARPSSKSESLEATLSRIPARRVLRVELGRGDIYGSDYAGKSQVVNIILIADGGFDGSVTVVARRRFTGRIVPDFSATGLWKRGHSSVSVSAGAGISDYIEEGTDRLTALPGGELVEFRRKVNDIRQHDRFVSGSWALEQDASHSARLNFSYTPHQDPLYQVNHVIPSTGPERDDRLAQDYRNGTLEFGGDISRPFAGGALKLVGLVTRARRNNQDRVTNRLLDGSVVGGLEQSDIASRGETIAKLSWTRSNLAGFSVETGGEIALNSLDDRVDLFAIEDTGAKTRIDLPIDHATVREKRAEAYVNAGRLLSPALRVDAGLTFETSQLTVRGAARAGRSLHFLKPSVTIDYKAPHGWHGQLAIRRTVAQLNFYDFISSATLSSGQVSGGNAQLLPQRAWEMAATVERPLWSDGVVKLDLAYQRISQLQDRILSPEGLDAPGNLGRGTLSSATFTIDASLQRFGLTGTRLKADATFQRTRVHDPISDAMRSFSGYFPSWSWEASLRRDAGKFAYGMKVQDRASVAFYRADEIDANPSLGPYATAFLEYRPDARTTVTLDVDNWLNNGGGRDRLFFLPNRSSPSPSFREVRVRNSHLSFGLTFKRSFSGSRASVAA